MKGAERSEERIGVAELLDAPDLLADLKQDAIPRLLGDVARQQAALASLHDLLLVRLATSRSQQAADSLLTVDDAARRLALSPDYLYRHSDELPFTVRIGTQLRFSAEGIERFIRRNSLGRPY